VVRRSLGLSLFVGKLPAALTQRMLSLSSGGFAVALVLILLVVGAIALLRYLLLSLFTPRAAPSLSHAAP